MRPLAEVRGSPYVNRHAQDRWLQRVNPQARTVDAIAALKEIVDSGRELKGVPRRGEYDPMENCYFRHPNYPGVVAVVARASWCVVSLFYDPVHKEASP